MITYIFSNTRNMSQLFHNGLQIIGQSILSLLHTSPHSPTHSVSEAISSPTTAKKRRGRHRTPIVDAEVRRSARLRSKVLHDHIQLDGEPRTRKGKTKKYVSFSTVTDLKKAIVGSSLYEGIIEFEVAPIQAPTLVDLGISFCGVPPLELNLATLLHEGEDP
jgi:hypothetical protein